MSAADDKYRKDHDIKNNITTDVIRILSTFVSEVGASHPRCEVSQSIGVRSRRHEHVSPFPAHGQRCRLTVMEPHNTDPGLDRRLDPLSKPLANIDRWSERRDHLWLLRAPVSCRLLGPCQIACDQLPKMRQMGLEGLMSVEVIDEPLALLFEPPGLVSTYEKVQCRGPLGGATPPCPNRSVQCSGSSGTDYPGPIRFLVQPADHNWCCMRLLHGHFHHD